MQNTVMFRVLQQWLRKQVWWLRLRELEREGFLAALQRSRIQNRILDTPPLRTGSRGPVEVRVLTWRRDWVNLIWAVKSYYHFAGVDYPLVIHDGGLLPRQVPKLLAHFPDAKFVPMAESNVRFPGELKARGFARSAEYRVINPTTRKVFDFFLDTNADYVVSIDSDIVFFDRPDELIVPPDGLTKNRYNRDSAYWYSMTLDELEAAFGVRPPPLINSGLSVIRRESIDFARIDGYLANPKLYENNWVTEQTLHALCSTVYGVEFLHDTYMVAGGHVPPGIPPGTICKHYPGGVREPLYSEGMPYLIRNGFLDALRGKK
jgi:hypothetical protein